MIQTKIYKLALSVSLNNNILSEYINNFWNDVFKTELGLQHQNGHLLLMVKVKFADSTIGYRSLAPLRRVNFTDKDLFINFIIDRLGLLSESYNVDPVSELIFSYITRDGLASGDQLLLSPTKYEVTTHIFNNLQLPLTMDPTEYGTILATEVNHDGEGSTRYIVTNNKNIFQIDTSNTVNKVSVLGGVDLQWIDTLMDDNTIFKREIDSNVLYIKDGERIVSEKQLPAKPFKKVKLDSCITTSYFFK